MWVQNRQQQKICHKNLYFNRKCLADTGRLLFRRIFWKEWMCVGGRDDGGRRTRKSFSICRFHEQRDGENHNKISHFAIIHLAAISSSSSRLSSIPRNCSRRNEAMDRHLTLWPFITDALSATLPPCPGQLSDDNNPRVTQVSIIDCFSTWMEEVAGFCYSSILYLSADQFRVVDPMTQSKLHH